MEAEWVESNEQLAEVAALFTDTVAIDTEFVRTNTYYPMPGLYQVACGSRAYLLDPLKIDDWTPFRAVLEDPGVVKIMHACLEDLELIYHHLNCVLKNVFDTQYAQAFVSEHFSLSYANLVDVRLGHKVSKHETRSNWLQRPLTPEQLDYAVEDVLHLQPLYDGLIDELRNGDKLEWFREDMRLRETYSPQDPDRYYQLVKKAWQFNPRQLSRLKVLCAWRERKAQTLNVPRNRVVWDDHLYKFARADRLSTGFIYSVLPRAVARRYAEEVMSLVGPTEVESVGDEVVPLPKPLTSQQGGKVKALRSVGLELAETQGIAPELVCRRRDLEDCVRYHTNHGRLPEDLGSWRQVLVGDRYMQVLSGQ